MPNYCVAMWCCNEGAYIFPKDAERRRLWVNFVKSKRADFVAPSSSSRLCAKHFRDEDFENLMQVSMGLAQRFQFIAYIYYHYDYNNR